MKTKQTKQNTQTPPPIYKPKQQSTRPPANSRKLACIRAPKQIAHPKHKQLKQIKQAAPKPATLPTGS